MYLDYVLVLCPVQENALDSEASQKALSQVFVQCRKLHANAYAHRSVCKPGYVPSLVPAEEAHFRQKIIDALDKQKNLTRGIRLYNDNYDLPWKNHSDRSPLTN